MGRGSQERTTDAFAAVFGRGRGTMHPEDAFVLGHPSFDSRCKEIAGNLGPGGRWQEALDLFEDSRPQLTLDNPHVRVLLAALAAQGVNETLRGWLFAEHYEANVLGLTKRGRSPGLSITAKKVWERVAQAKAVEFFEVAVESRGPLQLDSAFLESCHEGMIAAFAFQCNREGQKSVLRVGGPQPELERALGTWPPKRDLGSFWGLGDWQYLLASRPVLKEAMDSMEAKYPPEEISASVVRKRKRYAQDLRSDLSRAERRGSPQEPFIIA